MKLTYPQVSLVCPSSARGKSSGAPLIPREAEGDEVARFGLLMN